MDPELVRRLEEEGFSTNLQSELSDEAQEAFLAGMKHAEKLFKGGIKHASERA